MSCILESPLTLFQCLGRIKIIVCTCLFSLLIQTKLVEFLFELMSASSTLITRSVDPQVGREIIVSMVGIVQYSRRTEDY
uniref:Uncharacterized protein n=1 Tax=Oryza brachyantha TaxID=4533 RepID=J3MGE9_ORYBR